MVGGQSSRAALVARDLWNLSIGAWLRHKWMVLTPLVLSVVAAVGLLRILPRSYHVECRILALRNLVMPALGNPHRAIPAASDNPTQAVPESILARDNLIAIIKRTDLLDRWETERSPLSRFKDLILSALKRAPSDSQRLDALVGVLEKRFQLVIDADTVSIAIDWPNAETAAQLVQVAQDDFLATRHATEVSTIAETISILESHAADVRSTIDSTFVQVERGSQDLGLAPPQAPRSSHRSTAAVSDQLSQLAEKLAVKRRQIAELERFHSQQVQDVAGQLAEQRLVYAPAHPAIAQTEANLQQLSAEPPELRQLRAQEEELALQYIQAKELAGDLNAERPPPPAEANETDFEREKRETEDDRPYPKARLEIAFDNYDDLQRRLDAARIELDTAQAAFKYRYRIIDPVKVPRDPSSPKPALVLLGGALIGLLGGLSAALIRDARRDRIRSAWQLEHWFKIRVLAEIPLQMSVSGDLEGEALVSAAEGVRAAEAVFRKRLQVCFAALGVGIFLGVALDNLWLVLAPPLLVLVLWSFWKAPLRIPALAFFFLALVLNSPKERPADGMWRSPLTVVGGLLYENLNNLTGISSLRFAGIDLLLIGFVAAVVLRQLRGQLHQERRPTGLDPILAVAFGAVLVLEVWGIATGGDFKASLWQIRELLGFPILVWLFLSAELGPADFPALGALILVAAFLKTCEGFYFYEFICRPLGIKPPYVTTHSDTELFVAATLVCAVGWLLGRRRPFRWALAAAAVVPLFGIILNNRRLAFVSLAANVALLYAAIPLSKLKRAVTRGALIASPFLILYLGVGWGSDHPLFTPVHMLSTVLSRDDVSSGTRDIENFNLIQTLKVHPLQGWGFGHPYLELSRAYDISNVFPLYRYIGHNSVLWLWSVGGLMGFSAVWMPILLVVFFAARCLIFARTRLQQAGALVALSVPLTHMLQAYGDMGLQGWSGAFLTAAALATTSRLAVELGVWPTARPRASAPLPGYLVPERV